MHAGIHVSLILQVERTVITSKRRERATTHPDSLKNNSTRCQRNLETCCPDVKIHPTSTSRPSYQVGPNLKHISPPQKQVKLLHFWSWSNFKCENVFLSIYVRKLPTILNESKLVREYSRPSWLASATLFLLGGMIAIESKGGPFQSDGCLTCLDWLHLHYTYLWFCPFVFKGTVHQKMKIVSWTTSPK